MAIKIAVANRKGGVAKTTTAVNLSAALAGEDQRVLMIDMDPSGSLTNHVNIELNDDDNTVFEVLSNGADIRTAIKHVHNDRTGTDYDVLPADGALNNLRDVPQERLREVLTDVEGDYDFVIMDSQPTFGEPTAQVLTAADEVLIPAGADYDSLDAVRATIEVISQVKGGLNPNIDIIGIFMTRYNPRRKFDRRIREAYEKLPEDLLDVFTSDGIGVKEAAAEGTDLLEHIAVHKGRSHTRAAEQYRELGTFILKRK